MQTFLKHLAYFIRAQKGLHNYITSNSYHNYNFTFTMETEFEFTWEITKS